MAQSAGTSEQLEDIRDEIAAIHKEVDALKGRVAEVEKAKPVGGGDQGGLRAEFDRLKEQLTARLGHSLD